MPPALIAQLILAYGIPATRAILELVRSNPEPTIDQWLTMLNSIETHANAFLARTAYLDQPTPLPTP